MFLDKSNPSMNELVHWFQVNYTVLANDMKQSNHAAVDNEPNPYHIEDSIFTHTMMVCLQAENNNSNKVVMISALLHDIGKCEAREVIPFDVPKPVYSESNKVRNDGKNDGKSSGLQRDNKKFPDSMIDNMSNEQLMRRFPKEYEEFNKL